MTYEFICSAIHYKYRLHLGENASVNWTDKLLYIDFKYHDKDYVAVIKDNGIIFICSYKDFHSSQKTIEAVLYDDHWGCPAYKTFQSILDNIEIGNFENLYCVKLAR